MAISNELSSEIAAAILADKKTPQELFELKDVVLRVHSTLQQMSEEVRATRSENRLRRASATGKPGRQAS
jgi:predicted transcriptional regulator